MARVNGQKTKRDLNIQYNAYPVPQQFHASNAFVRVILGPVGSGKSAATWMELFRRACEEWPNDDGVRSSMHLCVRDTYAMLKSTTIADFLSWFGRIADIVYDSPIRANITMPLSDGTTLDWNLRFLSMDGGDKSLDALRGMAISAAYLNEGHSLSKDVYEVVATRVGRYRPAGRDPKWKGIIVDSNYGYQRCHLHNVYKDTPDTWAFFEQPPSAIWNTDTNKWELNHHCDNLAYLPGGIDYYDKMLSMSDEFIRQFMANKWAIRAAGKAIYPEFSPQTHIIKGAMQPDRNLPLIIGMDFGLHVACAIFQLSPQGRLVMFKEVCGDDVDLEEFMGKQLIPTLRNEFPGYRAVVCGDPAGVGRSALDKRTAFQVVKSYGLAAYPAMTNSPERRWGAVKYFLSRQNGFGVHHTCKRTIEGFEGAYGFKKRGDGGFSEDADKGLHSHIADAVQYAAIFARFGAKKDTNPYEHARLARDAARKVAGGRRSSGGNADNFFWA